MGIPKAERIRLWYVSCWPNALLIAIAAEEADLRAAKRSGDSRSQNVTGDKKRYDAEKDEKRHVRIGARKQR